MKGKIIILLFTLVSCSSNEDNTSKNYQDEKSYDLNEIEANKDALIDYYIGPSTSVEQSKNRKLFIKYYLTDTIIKFNDSLSFCISESWIEKEDGYGTDQNIVFVMKDPFTSLISVKDFADKNHLTDENYDFPYDWSLVTKDNCFNFSGLTCGRIGEDIVILKSISTIQNFDFFMIKGFYRIKDSTELNHRIIAEFSLIKPQ